MAKKSGNPKPGDLVKGDGGYEIYKPPDYIYTPPPAEPDPPATTTVTSSYLPVPAILNNTEPPRSNQSAIVAGKLGDPEPYVFGRCIADPVIVSADDSGQYLYVDMLWSVGEIDYIEYLMANNKSVGRVDALGKVQHFEGTGSQVASTIMVDLKGDYDALLNKAHSVVPLLVGEGVIERAMIRGVKLV